LFARAVIVELLEGLWSLELPKPFGAWPRSVVLPWALQLRELLVAVLLPLLPGILFCMRILLLFAPADGGRLCDS
jgi:hypothetical protein